MIRSRLTLGKDYTQMYFLFCDMRKHKTLFEPFGDTQFNGFIKVMPTSFPAVKTSSSHLEMGIVNFNVLWQKVLLQQ